MSDITRLTAAELAQKLQAGDITSEQATQAHLDRIAAVDPTINAFVTVTAEDALATARDVDERRARGEQLHPLAGVPIAIKDVVVTDGVQTTAGSKMLEGWIPPYDATLVEKIKEARLPILGKTNMDEFAMGSSTEHSAYGNTLNPWDIERIPGGSEEAPPQLSQLLKPPRDRDRHRWVHPSTRGSYRNRGGQTHLWFGVPIRVDRYGILTRPGRTCHPDCVGCSTATRTDRWA